MPPLQGGNTAPSQTGSRNWNPPMPPPSPSRRRFMSTLLAAGAAAMAAPKPARKYKYIDMHTHLGAFYWEKEVTADGLVRWMDEHDIEKAVILPLVSPEAGT